MMEAVAAARSISPTWDIVLIAFLFIGGFFYGLSVGKTRLVVIMAGAYITLAVFPLIPLDMLLESLAPMQKFALQAILFLLTIFVCYIILMRSTFAHTLRGLGRDNGWYQVVVLTIPLVGFIIVAVLEALPRSSHDTLAPLVQMLFVDESVAMWWKALPLAALLLVKGR